MKIIHSMSLLLFGLLGGITLLTSCSKEPKVIYPESKFMQVHKIYSMWMEQKAVLDVWIENEDLIKAVFENDSLKLYPQKTGTTRVVVSKTNNSVLMDCTVEIAQGMILLQETQSDLQIELGDESYRQTIENEIAELYRFNNSTSFYFQYATNSEGNFSTSTTIEQSGNETTTRKSKGNFRVIEDELILVYEDNSEEKFIITKTVLSNEGEIKELTLIKDYTDYFRDKYPQANVTKTYRLQVWDDSIWDNR